MRNDTIPILDALSVFLNGAGNRQSDVAFDNVAAVYLQKNSGLLSFPDSVYDVSDSLVRLIKISRHVR